MSASKQKGTREESGLVTWLRENGFPYADRVPLSGKADRGDVTLGPGSPVIEVKNQKRHSLADWLDEAKAEAVNARAPFGVVWFHRRGKGSPADAYVLMDGATFATLLRSAGWGDAS